MTTPDEVERIAELLERVFREAVCSDPQYSSIGYVIRDDERFPFQEMAREMVADNDRRLEAWADKFDKTFGTTGDGK